jgi:hypothetical protein
VVSGGRIVSFRDDPARWFFRKQKIVSSFVGWVLRLTEKNCLQNPIHLVGNLQIGEPISLGTLPELLVRYSRRLCQHEQTNTPACRDAKPSTPTIGQFLPGFTLDYLTFLTWCWTPCFVRPQTNASIIRRERWPQLATYVPRVPLPSPSMDDLWLLQRHH